MKILMEFPKPKDEEQANAMPEVERKQVWLAVGALPSSLAHSRRRFGNIVGPH
jgi:hypothetical protein